MATCQKAPNIPTIFVVFGATGDLMCRKIMPALAELHKEKALPTRFQVVGFSRKDLSHGAFRELMQKESGISGAFAEQFLYQQGDFDKREGYHALKILLTALDEEWGVCTNKLFYLAVPPHYYDAIFEHLAFSGLAESCNEEEKRAPLEVRSAHGKMAATRMGLPLTGWTRVIVEKPFGNDSKTARKLDIKLGKLFEENQIYRIDHYLGKETVQNILAFRFSNSFLQPAWNKDGIERIAVRLYESSGIDRRGGFYDAVGALRDVGQNHLLQLLALFTMENPLVFDAQSIRKKRADALRSLIPLRRSDVASGTIRGQYKGYREISDVSKNSKTETYFRIEAEMDDPRWEGVPLLLESGKRMPRSLAEVEVTFRHEMPCLCPKDGPHQKNVLKYEIQPREKISTSFWVKKPGEGTVIEEKDFSFDYRTAYPQERFKSAYERLLLAAIAGEQTLFVSTEEIMASWKFVDPIVSGWENNAAPLRAYMPCSESILGVAFPRDVDSALKREIGLVGLGKMGKNMALRLTSKGWRVVAYDTNEKTRADAERKHIETAPTLHDLISRLTHPRLIWFLIPAGNPVETALFGDKGLLKMLQRGDTIADAGNSFYEDSIRRARKIKKSGIAFVDVGFSGGPEGARNGASLMIGGARKDYDRLIPLFTDLAVPHGYGYVGPHGAGHFVKMVHNGIEYGMMQSLAEGIAIMKKFPTKLDLLTIAEIYNHGSVIESRLVGWLEGALRAFGDDFKGISGTVGATGEGEWTAKTAKKFKVSARIIEDSVKFRKQSAKNPSYTGQVLSALRNQFGGHAAEKSPSKKKRER